MLSMFNYSKSDMEIFNDIVDGVNEAVRQNIVGIKDRKAYDELNQAINENVAKYLVSGTRYEAAYESQKSELLKNPMVTKNKGVKENFDAVLAQIITSAIPLTTSSRFGDTFMDVHQIGWGDTARFVVSSNDLFRVNEIAEGVNRGVLQPIYNNEFTVDCGPITISTGVDFYLVAAGNFDWGNFGMRAGASFNGYIMLKAIAALATAINNQSGAYTQAGISTNTWTTLVQKVGAANGGRPVYVLGTLTDLGQAIPQTVGLQYGLGEEVAKDGYLDKYLTAKLVPFDQFIVPGTVNSTADLGIENGKLYFIPGDNYKIIKTVYEGNSVVIEEDPVNTTDKFYGITVTYRVGVAAVVGNKIGVITL